MDNFGSNFSMYITNMNEKGIAQPVNDFYASVPNYVNFHSGSAKTWSVALTELSLPKITSPINYKGKLDVFCSVVNMSVVDGTSRPLLRRLFWKRDVIFDNLQYIRVSQRFFDHIQFKIQGDNNLELIFDPTEVVYMTLNFKLK